MLPFCLFALPAVLLAQTCGTQTACPLDNRSYHLLEPDDWDGITPLPVLLHFHGWGRQGDLIIKHQRIAGHTRRRGVLLIAPNGQGRTWNFWNANTQDVDFATSVIEDVARRYPIDRDQIYVSGYSYGAAMAWRYACENGDSVHALLAVSGSIDQTETCPQTPRHIRHVHGLDDTVMDFPMGADNDTTYPVALWREHLNCGLANKPFNWFIREFLTFTRSKWTTCDDGHTVTLDVHPGGHFIPHGWIGWQLDELMGNPPQYP